MMHRILVCFPVNMIAEKEIDNSDCKNCVKQADSYSKHISLVFDNLTTMGILILPSDLSNFPFHGYKAKLYFKYRAQIFDMQI